MDDARKILLIDTALEGCSVAVFDAARGVAYAAYNDEAFEQAQQLVPMVQDVMAQSGAVYEALAAIVVVNGPGTFTGIRIGLSTAKAMGMAAGVDVFAVSSLCALAMSAGDDLKDFLVLVETRRQDFYVQRFEGGLPIGDAFSKLAEDIDVDGGVLIGNAVERFVGMREDADVVRGDVTRIDLEAVARAFCAGVDLFSCDVAPIYLRAPDVSQPKKIPRKLAEI